MARRPQLGYFEGGTDLCASETYADSVAPTGPVSLLPMAAYRSLNFAYLEDERVWTRDWVCIGTERDIPRPGDLLPYTLGNHGIHVQRQQDGSLRGAFNSAQHGGCRVVPLQCQGGGAKPAVPLHPAGTVATVARLPRKRQVMSRQPCISTSVCVPSVFFR